MCRDRNRRGRTHEVLLLRRKGTEATLKRRSLCGRFCAFSSPFPFLFLFLFDAAFFFPFVPLVLVIRCVFFIPALAQRKGMGTLGLREGWSSLSAPGCAVLLCTGKSPCSHLPILTVYSEHSFPNDTLAGPVFQAYRSEGVATTTPSRT